MNHGFALGSQSSDRKRHRDPMIAKRIYLRSMQSLSARNLQAIFAFLKLRSHGSQIRRDRGNPV
jgi:hypothetical protein